MRVWLQATGNTLLATGYRLQPEARPRIRGAHASEPPTASSLADLPDPKGSSLDLAGAQALHRLVARLASDGDVGARREHLDFPDSPGRQACITGQCAEEIARS